MPRELVRALESDSRGLPLDVQAKRRIGARNSWRSRRETETFEVRLGLSFSVGAADPREVRLPSRGPGLARVFDGLLVELISRGVCLARLATGSSWS